MKNTELIVMLTYNDFTVENAFEIFETCKETKATYWGFKDKGLPVEEMKKLFSFMKSCGKTTILEVVEYTETKSLAGAKLALYCGCDILMGTTFFESVNTYCIENNIKYMPFAGNISGRPSILEGNIEEIISEAQLHSVKGIYGFDLLGYRYTEDADELIAKFVKETELPTCVAGSIDSFEKLDFVKLVSPWSITIGSAFFDNKFGGSFKDQINKVCDYMQV